MTKCSTEQTFVSPGQFVLNEFLLPGDIIITRDPNHWVSLLIRTGAWIAGLPDGFSHAILCTHPPYAVESADSGVVVFSLKRFGIRERSNIRVLRLKGRNECQDKIQKAVSWVVDQTTSAYAERDVLKVVLPNAPATEKGKYFCSQLVAMAYQQGGIALLPEVSPDKTAPAHFAESVSLEDVTDKCLRECKLSDLPWLTGCLDEDSPDSLAGRVAEAKQKIVEEVAPKFEMKLDEASILMTHGIRKSSPRTEPFSLFGELLVNLVMREQARRDVKELDGLLTRAIWNSKLLEIPRSFSPPGNEWWTKQASLWRFLNSDQNDPRYAPTAHALDRFYADASAIRRESMRIAKERAESYLMMAASSDCESVRLTAALESEIYEMMRSQSRILAACHVLFLTAKGEAFDVEMFAGGKPPTASYSLDEFDPPEQPNNPD